MSDVDDAISAARSSWARISDTGDGVPTRARRRRTASIARRLTWIAGAIVAILIAATLWGLVAPLGIMGAVVVMAVMVAAVLFLSFVPGQRAAPPPEKLKTVDIRALPAQTERWLGAQRGALPRPAQVLVDRIGERLDTLSPQLARIEPQTEEAFEVRRLVGEQLPAFVNDYARVPDTLRTVERNGRTPDAELVAGLQLIEREIADMTARLAQGDLDNLQTRGRFLEMKYKDGDETG